MCLNNPSVINFIRLLEPPITTKESLFFKWFKSICGTIYNFQRSFCFDKSGLTWQVFWPNSLAMILDIWCPWLLLCIETAMLRLNIFSPLLGLGCLIDDAVGGGGWFAAAAATSLASDSGAKRLELSRWSGTEAFSAKECGIFKFYL